MCTAKPPSAGPATRPQKPPNQGDMLTRAQDMAKRRMGYAATAVGSTNSMPATSGKMLLGQ